MEAESTSSVTSNFSESSSANSIPDIYRVTWDPEDHVEELIRILEDVSVEHVEDRLVQYVVEIIEPAGWRAAWKVGQNSAQKLLGINTAVDLVVDVVDVNRDKLEAVIRILDVASDLSQDDQQAIKTLMEKQIAAPLTELFPLAEQENELLDINTTAEVVDQLRFFFQYIWYPWDIDEENCCYNRFLVTSRFKVYQDMIGNGLPGGISGELSSLLTQGEELVSLITVAENSMDADPDAGVDERDVVSLMNWHKQLEQLKQQFDVLQDPVLRELSAHQRQLECRSVVSNGSVSGGAKVKVVLDCLEVQALDLLARLPQLLDNIPQIDNAAKWSGYPNLQLALDTSLQGDVIILLPGTHRLHNLGLIRQGGTLCGLGADVVLEGSSSVGDILLDITGEMILQDITLRTTQGQVAVVHHKGNLQMTNVTIEGSGVSGVLALGASRSQLKGLHVKQSTQYGLDIRSGAQVELTGAKITQCEHGLQLEESAKVCLYSCEVTGNRSSGIQVVWPEDVDTTKFDNIPKDQLLQCLLQDCANNKIEDNLCDVSMVKVAAICHPSKSPSPSSPTISQKPKLSLSIGSLDSGCEFIENHTDN